MSNKVRLKENLHKVTYRIELFAGCPIYGLLKFDKEDRGYLKLYDEDGEITKELDNYNPIIIASTVAQARAICEMEYATLYSY